MLRLSRRAICIALLGLAIVGSGLQRLAQADDSKTPDIAGAWNGTLDVGALKLRLVIEFKKKDGGGYTGTMDSPDQGAAGLEIDEITLKDRSLKFVMKKIGGSYEGEVSADGKLIKGMWKQGGLSLALDLKPGEKVAPPKRPQEPKPPFPYESEEVSFENKAGGIKIAGTLTRPKGDGPFPAVLLITGSGPQNRDEELLGHKPFLVLADYLTRRGIAVLRVDDRGVGGTTGKPSEATIDDHAGDALAGVAYLKSRKDIDAKKIGLAGHSEGGLIAPAAAARSSDVAFVVMLAGTGVTGEEILYRQGELIAVAGGASAEAAARNTDLQKRLFAIARAEKDDAAAKAKIDELMKELKEALSEEDRKALESLGELADAQFKQVLTPWFRHFLAYDPAVVLAKVKCPVLAINGEKDLQVDPKQNLPPIEAALKAGGNKDYTLKELPGLNHLFQACKTGAPSEYSQIEETISDAALTIVGDWIVKHTQGR